MPSNIKITTAQLFDNNDALEKIKELLKRYPDIKSFTYVDSNKMYMYKNTKCQMLLPNELHIPLSNMPDYTTADIDAKAIYVHAELASWKPMIVTINNVKKHVVSHTEYGNYIDHHTPNHVTSSTSRPIDPIAD